MSSLDSVYRGHARTWPALYGERFRNLGTTATIINMGDQALAGKVNASTFTSMADNASGSKAIWTPSVALSALATPCDLTNPTNWAGDAPIVTFNGSSEYIDTPDITYYTSGDGSNDSAVSMIAWIKATGGATATIFSKYANGGGTREYIFRLNSTNFLAFYAEDESAGVLVSRISDAAVPLSQWIHIAMTYAGTGGATAMNGVTLYVNGTSVASTATNNASYVAMENTVQPPTIASLAVTPTDYLNGSILGGPFGFAYVQAQLTAAQVYNDYRLLSALGRQ